MTTAAEQVLAAALALPADERRLIADALYDDAEDAPLSAGQTAELERRLADSIANPGVGTPWEDVFARAMARSEP